MSTTETAEKKATRGGRKKPQAAVEANEAVLDGVLDALVEAPAEPGAAAGPREAVPLIGSDDWTPYVLSKFTPDELHDGCPTYLGLQRVCADLLGDIVGVDIIVPQAPNAANGNHACVIVRLTIDHPPHYTWLGGLAGRTIPYSHAGDVFMGNGPDTFAWRFSSSTCCTRTKASLLRDAFRLKHVYAKEELSVVRAEDSGADGLIIETQRRGLDVQCRRLGVNAAAFLRHCWRHLDKGRADYEDLARVPYTTAQKALQQITKWQQDRSQITDEMKGYDAGWLDAWSQR